MLCRERGCAIVAAALRSTCDKKPLFGPLRDATYRGEGAAGQSGICFSAIVELQLLTGMLYGLQIFRSNQTLEKVFTATHADIESARAFAVQRIGRLKDRAILLASNICHTSDSYLMLRL